MIKANPSSLPFPEDKVQKNFIVFEGLDGSGKSTQIARVAEALTALKKKFVLLREPSDLPSGKKLREALTRKESLGAGEELKLFLADRALNVAKNIMPALQRGEIVLQDRYIYSNAVYQGMHLGWETVLQKNLQMNFPLPRRTYYLDLSPRACMERMSKRNLESTYFEKLEILEKIAEIYKIIANWDRGFQIIPAQGAIDNVSALIKEDLISLITK